MDGLTCLVIHVMETGALEAYFGTTIPDELFFQESTRSVNLNV